MIFDYPFLDGPRWSNILERVEYLFGDCCKVMDFHVEYSRQVWRTGWPETMDFPMKYGVSLTIFHRFPLNLNQSTNPRFVSVDFTPSYRVEALLKEGICPFQDRQLHPARRRPLGSGRQVLQKEQQQMAAQSHEELLGGWTRLRY